MSPNWEPLDSFPVPLLYLTDVLSLQKEDLANRTAIRRKWPATARGLSNYPGRTGKVNSGYRR
jgi:hypothetical protein